MPKNPKIQEAIKLATEAHDGQLRKTGEPYIIHPLAVKKILEEWNMDEDTIIAGILHDTVEDTDITLKDIEEKFGHDVAFLVDGVTKLSKARSGMKNLDSYLRPPAQPSHSERTSARQTEENRPRITRRLRASC